jgi:hypothetical protein
MLQQLLRRQASCPAPHESPGCILAAQRSAACAVGYNAALSISESTDGHHMWHDMCTTR